MLVEARRLASGERPYRDYDPVYGPLEPALLALVGPQLLALRIVRTLALAAVAAALAAAAWRLGARSGALLVAAAVVWARHPEAHPAIAPIAVSCVALELAGRAGRRRWLLATGACAGIAALFRAEFGLAGLLAAIGAVSIDALCRREMRSSVRAAGWIVAGALPFGIAALGVVLAGGPSRALELAEATRESLAFRVLPLPLSSATPEVFLAELPLAVAPVTLVLVARSVLRAARDRRAAPPRLAVHLGLILLGILPHACWRPDRPHLFASFSVAAALVCIAFAGIERRVGHRLRSFCFLASCGILAALAGVRIARALRDGRDAALVSSRLPGLAGVLVPASYERDCAATARALAKHSQDGAPVFVGTGSARDGWLAPEHDRIFLNDALLYVVLGRRAGVRQHAFVPGVTTTEATQRELVADLERHDVRIAVLALGLYREEPNRNAERGAKLLDDWLFDHFAPVSTTGSYAVLVRR